MLLPPPPSTAVVAASAGVNIMGGGFDGGSTALGSEENWDVMEVGGEGGKDDEGLEAAESEEALGVVARCMSPMCIHIYYLRTNMYVYITNIHIAVDNVEGGEGLESRPSICHLCICISVHHLYTFRYVYIRITYMHVHIYTHITYVHIYTT